MKKKLFLFSILAPILMGATSTIGFIVDRNSTNGQEYVNNLYKIDYSSLSILGSIPIDINGTFPHIGFNLDGSKVLISSYNTNDVVQIYNASTLAFEGNITIGGDVSEILPDYTNKNKIFVLNRGQGYIHKFDITTFAQDANVSIGESDKYWAFVQSSDGKKLYVANQTTNSDKNSSILIYNTSDFSLDGNISMDGNVTHAIALNSSTTKLYVENWTNADHNISVFDLTTKSYSSTIQGVKMGAAGMVVGGGDKYLYLLNNADSNDSVGIFNLTTNTFEKNITIDYGVRNYQHHGLALTPDGNYVAVPLHDANKTIFINTTTNTIDKTLTGINDPVEIAFVPYTRVDSDNDGVIDSSDNCANTLSGYSVNSVGCATYQLDSDSDGFNDAIDNCPTISGTDNGCPYVYVQTDVTLPISGFEGDVTIPPTIKPIELDDGTNQFNVESDTSNTIVNIPTEESANTVDITITSNEVETKISIPKDAKLSVKTDGSISQSLKVENTKMVIDTSNSGASNIQTETSESKKSVNIPAGSTINMNESGEIIATKEVIGDVESNEKPIAIKVEAKPNEEVIVTATIENQNFSMKTRKESYETKIELLEKNARTTKVIYYGIKSTFSSRKKFNLSQNLKRDAFSGENIEIFPTTSWQRFEERVYFNGERTIKLLLGGANLIVDGESIQMEKEVEYTIDIIGEDVSVIEIEDNNSSENNESMNNNLTFTLELFKGWNLISNPIDTQIDIKNSFENYQIAFKYNGSWIVEPITLSQGEGAWIECNIDNNVSFEGNFYENNFTNLNYNWNLLGVGRDTTISELSEFKDIWVYSAKTKEWINNPNTIYRGYGFWAK